MFSYDILICQDYDFFSIKTSSDRVDLIITSRLQSQKNLICILPVPRNSMELLLDTSMAFGPVVGYVHQYYVIFKSKSVGTFSIDICGILLFANILRLNFFVFQKYAISLLFQSIIMIIAQVFLVHICTKYNQKNKNFQPQSQSSSTESNIERQSLENLDNFWRWNLFSTYLLFILFFTFITFSITVTFKQLDMNGYGIMIGLVALLSESVLILPQVLKNFQNKSTKGLSYVLVGLNLFGDIFKLVYFIIMNQAFQFILCGAIQVCLDSFVIVQIFWYRKNDLYDDKDNKPLSPKYDIEDEIKPQTEKNLDDIQMNNVPPQVAYEVQQIFNFQADDDFVICQNEPQKQKMQKYADHPKSTHQHHYHNPEHPKMMKQQHQQNEKQQQKVIYEQIQVKSPDLLPETERNSFLETNPSEVLEIKKVQSHQPSTVSSQQFFKTNFSHQTKSLSNIEVQC